MNIDGLILQNHFGRLVVDLTDDPDHQQVEVNSRDKHLVLVLKALYEGMSHSSNVDKALVNVVDVVLFSLDPQQSLGDVDLDRKLVADYGEDELLPLAEHLARGLESDCHAVVQVSSSLEHFDVDHDQAHKHKLAVQIFGVGLGERLELHYEVVELVLVNRTL